MRKFNFPGKHSVKILGYASVHPFLYYDPSSLLRQKLYFDPYRDIFNNFFTPQVLLYIKTDILHQKFCFFLHQIFNKKPVKTCKKAKIWCKNWCKKRSKYNGRSTRAQVERSKYRKGPTDAHPNL